MTAIKVSPKVQGGDWQWRNFQIHYRTAGASGPAILLIHGFGASSIHWRYNIEPLSAFGRVFAIDLIGFGQSDKPAPGPYQPGQQIEYTFENWGQQVADFCREVIGSPAYLVGNSIGAIVALQAAVIAPEQVCGVAMLDCSLRLLHERKRTAIPWYRRLATPVLQRTLSYRPLGAAFFRTVAKPRAVRRILTQAYGYKTAVNEELIQALLAPAQDPGAADVFLAFIQYSQGPLAEDLLPHLTCPVLILWGMDDPWEPIDLGRALAAFPCVQDFIALSGVGHCPQDEAPEQVNRYLKTWIIQSQAAQ